MLSVFSIQAYGAEKTITWDFSEFTEQVILAGIDIDYEYNGPTLMGNTKSDYTSDYVSSAAGFHMNGASSSKMRYISYKPQYDGTMTVYFRSNNATATDRITAIGTAVKNFKKAAVDEGTVPSEVLAYAFCDSAKWVPVSADLEAGKTYYFYFAEGGQSIMKLEYTYTEPSSDPYLADFNTPIATSDHGFQVASNWRHIVDSYEDSWTGNDMYPSYSYSATAGVDGSGALSCSTNQNNNSLYDLLVTPVVKGTVTIDAKATASYYTPQLSFFKITDNGDGTFTRGDQITVDVSTVNSTDYTTLTIPVAEAGERIGIRSSYVWLDNFTATEATIIPEKKISIASAVPSATTGTIKWEQQSNGMVLVTYDVTVVNTGDVDLTQGTEGFSVSIINGSTGDVYGTVAVPQDLAKGDTSAVFTVSAEVETSIWPNSYTYIHMNLKENFFGSVVERAQSTYTAYEPKFVFRAAESTSTTSISAAEAWGTITESTTKSYEIANLGTAPLTIMSVTLPEGFTSDNAPLIETTLAKGETLALNITQDASALGTFVGTLSIVYLDKDSESQTYSLDFSATVIGENTWTADFNNTSSSIAYPVGCVAEGGINSGYQYISSNNYNNWIKGRTYSSYATENNKFITPKLHAAAGEKLAFDVKGVSGSNYYAKVYVSADRKNWGEPVAYYTYAQAEGAEAIGSDWVTKTITFDAEGDYYVAFSLYGEFAVDNIVGLTKVDVDHDLYIKSVSWPDASIKSGTAQSKPSVDIIPLTDETADNYTVKYIYGENEVEIASKALTASASSSTTFTASFTPEVENTTTFEGTKVVFEFTDGTTYETEPFDLTVTNEAIFHFLNTKPSSKWYEPTDRTAPIAFGKTNTADTQSFIIFNWGSAPLTVNSITLPEGFTTTAEFPLTVAAFNGENDGIDAACQALDITFSATAAGDYSGDMVITYSGDKTFTLPISGTKLDPSKFYANFGGESNQWPAGSVSQKNVSTTYVTTGNYAITSTNATDNLFITPKLTAAAGDKLMFDAKLYSSYWDEGKVVVYAAATRDELVNFDPENDTRTPLFSVCGEDSIDPMTTDWQTYEVAVPEAGDYYFGFEISGRPYVDEIYGLTPVAIAHDLAIAAVSIPAEAMQNVQSTATVSIQNFGLAEEAADAYTATLYVEDPALDDDVAAGTGVTVALPLNYKADEKGMAVTIPFRYPKAGPFYAYIEVKAGDFSVRSEVSEINFAEEEAIAEGKAVGTEAGTGRDYGFVDWYNADGNITRYTDILYPAAKITAAGFKAGDKITAISFKATNNAKKFNAVVTSWVGTSEGEITFGTPDKSAMQEISVYNGEIDAPANLESVLKLTNPIAWDGTSDIRIYTETEGQGSGNWMSANYAYDSEIQMSYNGTMKAGPVAYFTLAVESATLAGTVKNAQDAAVEGATVTLISADGDNVQYAGTTDAEGAYTINVIQATRNYNVTVVAEGYEDGTATVEFGGESKTQDFTLAAKPLLAEGTYYVYNPLTEKFLSRGNAWGTSAVVDDYGVAIKVALADGKYTLTGFDNNVTYGDDTWMFSDAGGDRARSYILNKVANGFTMTNTNNNMLVYVYTNENGDKYRVAGNAIKGDNYTNDAQTVWQFLTPEERNRMVADRETAAKTAAFEAAGIAENAQVEVAEPTMLTFASGHSWTQTVVRTQGGQPATNGNGTEMWQATGNYTQTVTNLPAGLYKVTIQAFYRSGNTSECRTRYATGYNTVLAYLEANGNKVQVQSWAVDADGNNPDNMDQAKAKFDAGKYVSEVYTYVGEDGNLNLIVNNPAHIGGGWFIAGNVKYAKVDELIIAGDANLDGLVTTGDAVAAVGFALERTVPSEKAFEAADINKSGKITVSDVVGIINIALDEELDARTMADNANNFLTMDGAEVSLMNSTTFVGFQMDVTLAQGAVLNGVELAQRAAGLTVAYNRVADNTYRIVAFSTDKAAIQGSEGALFSLNIAGNSNVTVSNVEFTDAAARAYALEVAATTGINSVVAGAAATEVYNLGGVKSDKVRKGLNVVRGADGKMKKVFVR